MSEWPNLIVPLRINQHATVMKDNIHKMISEKAGITEAQAKVAVDTMVNFIHDNMPSGPGHQVELLVQDSIGTLGTITDTFSTKTENFFGK